MAETSFDLTPMMRKLTLCCLPLWLVSGPGFAADNCDSIRSQIDTRIRATGVANFTLTTVDTTSASVGKVVGSCALGTKKIVYAQGATAASAPATAASAAGRRPAKPDANAILTECKNGSVSMGGDCKK